MARVNAKPLSVAEKAAEKEAGRELFKNPAEEPEPVAAGDAAENASSEAQKDGLSKAPEKGVQQKDVPGGKSASEEEHATDADDSVEGSQDGDAEMVDAALDGKAGKAKPEDKSQAVKDWEEAGKPRCEADGCGARHPPPCDPAKVKARVDARAAKAAKKGPKGSKNAAKAGSSKQQPAEDAGEEEAPKKGKGKRAPACQNCGLWHKGECSAQYCALCQHRHVGTRYPVRFTNKHYRVGEAPKVDWEAKANNIMAAIGNAKTEMERNALQKHLQALWAEEAAEADRARDRARDRSRSPRREDRSAYRRRD